MTKGICSKCRQPKELIEVWIRTKDMQDYPTKMCKECYNKLRGGI